MIRKAEVKDLDLIVKLEEKIFNKSLGYAFLKQELLENPFSRIFIYEVENKVIGYISVRVIDQSADIINFLIDIPYQSKGYGRSLFNAMLDELKQEEVTTLVLEVRETNDKAIGLYQSFGATVIRTIKNYYGSDDAYMMIMEVK